jgi:hypothetical protein
MKDLNVLPIAEVDGLAQEFREAMTRAYQIFGRYAFRKFALGARRGPVNKALFESWANSLQAYDFATLRLHKEKLVERVSQLLTSDADYVRSLSAGTGSARSVHTRFERAHQVIQEVLS